MSRWFREPLRLRLGGSEPEGIAADVLAAEPDRAADRLVTARRERLEQHLVAFGARLDTLAPASGTRLCCWLGGDIARHLIVPWQDSLSSAAQHTLLAQHCFREVFGAAATDWTVRLAPSSHGQPALASAVEAWVPERLDALARERRLKLVSVRPLLMDAHNAALTQLREHAQAWLVLLEPPRITLLLVRDGCPHAVKLVHARSADLGRLLEREWRSLGIDGPRCPVLLTRYGADTSNTASVLVPQLAEFGWELTVLEGLADQGPSTSTRPAAPLPPAATVAGVST